MVKAILALRSQKWQEELLLRLRSETSKHFLERAACDINDALTSILAVSDTEAPKTVPKIKKYIQRVNQSLQSLKVYQSALEQKSAFNVNAVLGNVLNVVEEHLREKITLVHSLPELKALAEGDQSELEAWLLYLFVQLAESGKDQRSEFVIELRQKDQEAVITIFNNSIVPGSVWGDIKNRAGGFKEAVQIIPHSTKTEFTLRLPLIFVPHGFSFQTSFKKDIRPSPWTARYVLAKVTL